MRLFIDDERMPPTDSYEWEIARSSNEAINFITCFGCPEFISFDHDLGDDDTSMIIIHWLIENDLNMPGFIPPNFSFFVHSQNPIGKKNIIGLLKSYLDQR